MHVEQQLWIDNQLVQRGKETGTCVAPQLVLVFASPARLRDPDNWTRLRERWPSATIIGGSTAGEICGTRVLDDSLVATAIQFERTSVRCSQVNVADAPNSTELGHKLAEQLLAPDLVHVFVLSDGLKVNGSDLVSGLTQRLPPHVAVTGGLCGDGARFERTHVCVDEFSPTERIAGIGFYGRDLRVGFGSLGGWDPFGPERRVTRSEGNILYELDGSPALDLYEQYLGEHAAGLPASGLLFPLTVRQHRSELGVVRTILAVDRDARSLTFAGDVPNGHYARLMRANFDRLLDGASGAAKTSYEAIGSRTPDLAILISCVGRKLVLGQRIEEEVEAVQQVLGEPTVLAGFYSYGEVSPFSRSARCELHNQTMTITTLSEG
ncbi:MAG TPA: FIST N-terminal domain-containing protein [Polyangiaceae bacterium]